MRTHRFHLRYSANSELYFAATEPSGLLNKCNIPYTELDVDSWNLGILERFLENCLERDLVQSTRMSKTSVESTLIGARGHEINGLEIDNVDGAEEKKKRIVARDNKKLYLRNWINYIASVSQRTRNNVRSARAAFNTTNEAKVSREIRTNLVVDFQLTPWLRQTLNRHQHLRTVKFFVSKYIILIYLFVFCTESVLMHRY